MMTLQNAIISSVFLNNFKKMKREKTSTPPRWNENIFSLCHVLFSSWFLEPSQYVTERKHLLPIFVRFPYNWFRVYNNVPDASHFELQWSLSVLHETVATTTTQQLKIALSHGGIWINLVVKQVWAKLLVGTIRPKKSAETTKKDVVNHEKRHTDSNARN